MMDIKDLLVALENPQVQEKIRVIMANKDVTENHSAEQISITSPALAQEMAIDVERSLAEQNEELQNQIKQLQQEKEELQKERDEMSAWRDSITNMLLSLVKKLNNGQIPQRVSANEMVDLINEKVEQNQNEMASSQREIQNLNARQQQAQAQNQELKNDLAKGEASKKELEVKLQYFENNFAEDLIIADLYGELSSDTKSSLAGIFKDTSIKGLVACGIQEHGISNLWEYIKTQVVNGNNADVVNLNKLFELLFKRFCLAYPMFDLQVLNSGDTFDTQSHIKHHSSTNMSGAVKEVLLQGYVNSKTNKIIKQSVVVL